MATLTGQLGSVNSRPGQFWLGSASHGVIQLVERGTVAETISSVLVMGKFQRLSQSISASEVYHTNADRARTVANAISVTDTIAQAASPWLYLTQIAVEVIYAGIPTLNLTQQLVEIVYKRGTVQSLTETVHVTDVGHPGTLNSQSVSDTVHITPTIGERDTIIRLTVASSISVTSAIVGRDNVNRQSRSDTVTVSTLTTERDTVNRQSVTSGVTVSSAFQRDGTFSLHVTDTATVGTVIGERDTVIRKTVTDNINVASNIGFAGIDDLMTVTERLTITSTVAGRNNHPRFTVITTATVNSSIGTHTDIDRLSVSDTVHVTSTIGERSSNPRATISDAIHVTSTILQRDTNVYIAITDNIAVSNTLTPKNTHPRITVSDSIGVGTTASLIENPDRLLVRDTVTVRETIAWRNTNVRITVSEHVATSQPIGERDTKVRLPFNESARVGENTGTSFRITPDRQAIFEFLTVGETYTAQQPKQSLADHVIVTGTIGNNQRPQSLNETVHVTAAFGGGDSNRVESLLDTISVTQTTVPRNAVSRLTSIDTISVISIATGRGPRVSILVTDRAVIDESLTTPNRISESVSDMTVVASVLGIHVIPTRYSMIESVTVRESMRVSPVVEVVQNPISVAERIFLPITSVHDRVTVADAVNRRTTKILLDTLTPTQTLTRPAGRYITVTDSVTAASDVTINGVFYRTLIDELVFPDRNFGLDTSLGTLDVPVLIGAFVANLVTLISPAAGPIVLAAPEWNDGEGNVTTVNPKRTMTGMTYTFIKTTDRRKLTWQFRMSVRKYIEFRDWLLLSISQQLNIIDWKGRTWVGYITNNPVDIADSKNTIAEWEVVELQLEAVLLSG